MRKELHEFSVWDNLVTSVKSHCQSWYCLLFLQVYPLYWSFQRTSFSEFSLLLFCFNFIDLYSFYYFFFLLTLGWICSSMSSCLSLLIWDLSILFPNIRTQYHKFSTKHCFKWTTPTNIDNVVSSFSFKMHSNFLWNFLFNSG